MELNLSSTKATKIALHQDKLVELSESAFGFKVGFSDEDLYLFVVIFMLKITDKDENYQLEVDYEAIFRTKEIINEDFKNSNFPKINAPAIAFPYFRAFISTITQQAGYQTIVLPTFNFSQMMKEK